MYMNNPSSNTQKNWKAAFITLSVHALLLLIFFLFSFKNPPPPLPVVEEGIEVNLGNSDIGFGDVQPLQPGDPAPSEEATASTPPPPIAEEADETEKEITERDDADAPEINKPTKKTEVKKNQVIENNDLSKKTKAILPETPPSPKPSPKPKAIFSGGSGTGGNGADDYNNSRNQGIAGGNGDQGKPGGNPNSDNYTGNGGNGSGGPRVVSGNRKIVKAYSFKGELDKATIYAVIKVSPDGKGTFIDFAKNSTTRNAAYKAAIIDYLPRIQFNSSNDASNVVVRFEFDVD